MFGVNDVDPETEVNHVIGTKSALAMLPTAFINPGDIAILPTPCYPVLGVHTEYLGGILYPDLPVSEENQFLPDLDSLSKDVLQRAKLLYLNFPNNPTGASATPEFFQKVVQFAKQNDVIVIHDAAYAALVFDGAKPLSFLDPRRKRCRSRTSLLVQIVQHDRLADRVYSGQPPSLSKRLPR